MIVAHKWGRAYGQRPSAILYSDPFDVAFDLLCLQAGVDDSEQLAKKAGDKGLLRIVKEV